MIFNALYSKFGKGKQAYVQAENLSEAKRKLVEKEGEVLHLATTEAANQDISFYSLAIQRKKMIL